MGNLILPSVNYHLWEPCNMRCKFCFATFQDVKQSILPKGHLPKQESLKVVEKLAKAEFEKITFAGGEPTLCPWLNELIEKAKLLGMTTMLVSNGSNLDTVLENPYLDWITLSIDSLVSATNLATGRAIVGKRPLDKTYYESIITNIHKKGIRLKINTVVSSMNWQENISNFIDWAMPERWKVLQVLPIKGQNDACIDQLLVDSEQFDSFVLNNPLSKQDIEVVPEDNNAMTTSYIMVDPAGRFFDNSKGSHSYSPPILDIGVAKALSFVQVDLAKFTQRKGFYNW